MTDSLETVLLAEIAANWFWMIATVFTMLALIFTGLKIVTNQWAQSKRTRGKIFYCLLFAILTLASYELYFYHFVLDINQEICDKEFPSCVPLTTTQQTFYTFLKAKVSWFLLISIPTDLFDSLAKMLYLLVQIDLLQIFSVLSDTMPSSLFIGLKRLTIVLHGVIGFGFLALDAVAGFHPLSWDQGDQDQFNLIYSCMQSILYLFGTIYFLLYEAWHYYFLYGFLKQLTFRVKNGKDQATVAKLKNLEMMRKAVLILLILDAITAASTIIYALSSYNVELPLEVMWMANLFVELMYIHVIIIAWLNSRAKDIQFPQSNKKTTLGLSEAISYSDQKLDELPTVMQHVL